jgi:hypothetical protein
VCIALETLSADWLAARYGERPWKGLLQKMARGKQNDPLQKRYCGDRESLPVLDSLQSEFFNDAMANDAIDSPDGTHWTSWNRSILAQVETR